ncbi:MAG: hypothetical protein N2B03_03120 [Boseongicola sp.]
MRDGEKISSAHSRKLGLRAYQMPKTQDVSQGVVSAALRASHREKDEGYHGIVARLNDRWRVITCQDGIQWILQHREPSRWRNRCFCMTSAALRREALRHGGDIDPAAWETLLALPAHFTAMRPITRTRLGVLE